MRLREIFESINEGIHTFHSSGVSTISKFNSFSHFGTEAAAVDRIKNLVKQKRLNPDAVITIYNVDLNIKNPLMIKDYANANHSASVYASALKDAKIIDQDTMYRIRINDPYELADPEDDPDELAKLWPKYEKANLATIKKILKSKGYDGLVYKNAAEDKGSLSYVILDPNQARITGKKQIPVKDLIKAKQPTKKVANPNATIKEDVTGPGVVSAPFLKDGPLRVGKHFVDRLRDRNLDLKTVSRFISRAIKKNKAEIEALPVDTSFILKSKFGLGVAVVKQETPNGIAYLLNTALPQFSPGAQQAVFLGDDSKLLDKKTPTIGELAEKYKTSLIAVELQLKKGVKVEMEHTKKHSVAKEIALDHLGEDLYYYEKLAKIEKTNEDVKLSVEDRLRALAKKYKTPVENVIDYLRRGEALELPNAKNVIVARNIALSKMEKDLFHYNRQ